MKKTTEIKNFDIIVETDSSSATSGLWYFSTHKC